MTNQDISLTQQNFTNLSQRILDTLRFFELQNFALTQFEIYKYLVNDKNTVAQFLDDKFEVAHTLPQSNNYSGVKINLKDVASCLQDLISREKVFSQNGFFEIDNGSEKRGRMIKLRVQNYKFAAFRERRIKKFLPILKRLPFVESVGLAGSQALGLPKPTSDIDFFIFTHPRRLWIARTLITAAAQVYGMRRHGAKIANRFCLNHYLSGSREVDVEKNFYKAMEYIKLRPLVRGKYLAQFWRQNFTWINFLFPNFAIPKYEFEKQYFPKVVVEKILLNRLGDYVEQFLQKHQLKRIRQGKFIFVKADELSFHPDSKHESLLNRFFAGE